MFFSWPAFALLLRPLPPYVRTSGVLATMLQGSEGIIQLLVDRRGGVSQQDSDDPTHLPSSSPERLERAKRKDACACVCVQEGVWGERVLSIWA